MQDFLRQSTASQSRAIGPFLDSTDYQTAETGLTIANTDIKLVVNGGASANKNSGGGTHRVNGVYGITFDATDTATVGEIEVSVVVSGALPVFTKFRVLEEVVYDALFAASALGYVDGATVNATKVGGTSQTARDIGASVLLSSGTGTGQLKLASGYVAMTWADIAAPTTVQNFSGTTIKTATDVETDTQDIQARLPAALTAGGNIKADALALSGDTVAADNAESFFDGTGYAGTNNVIPLVTTTTTAGALGAQAKLDVNAEADTALSDYGALKPTTAGRTLDVSAGGEAGVDLANIGSPTTVVNLSGTTVGTTTTIGATGITAIWAYVVEGSYTAVQFLRLIAASAVGKLSGAATTTVTIRDVSDTKDRVSATVDANGNRSAATYDGT